jgi:hypothetical protein
MVRSDEIQTISDFYSKMIIIIYLDSVEVQMFFPEKTYSFFYQRK